MDVSTITQIVRELGFPIACCFLLWKNNTQTLKDVTESINKNTVMLEKIFTVLDIHDEKGEEK